jgi:hypothetical protein
MKYLKYLFILLFGGVGILGVFMATIGFLQSRDGVFVGGIITNINALTFGGAVIALMGFAGAYLLARSKD